MHVPYAFSPASFLTKSSGTVTVNRAKFLGNCVTDAQAENRGIIIKAAQIMPQLCSCTFFKKGYAMDTTMKGQMTK